MPGGAGAERGLDGALAAKSGSEAHGRLHLTVNSPTDPLLTPFAPPAGGRECGVAPLWGRYNAELAQPLLPVEADQLDGPPGGG
eukprot:6617860-Pyramimonas_sp.AAC.2